METKKEEIGKVITGLVDIFRENTNKKIQTIIDSLDIEEGDLGKLVDKYKKVQKDITDVFQAFLVKNNVVHIDDFLFCLKNEEFIKRNIRKYIGDYEGISCSEDKVRYVFRGLLNYFETGKEYHVNYEQEYIYHCPEVTFLYHKNLMDLFNLIKGNLYCRESYPEDFLNFVRSILGQVKNFSIESFLDKTLVDCSVKNVKVLKKTLKFDLYSKDEKFIKRLTISGKDSDELLPVLESLQNGSNGVTKYIIREILLKIRKEEIL